MPPPSETDLGPIVPQAKTQAQALVEFLWVLFCCRNGEGFGIAAERGMIEQAGESFFGRNRHDFNVRGDMVQNVNEDGLSGAVLT